jgi:uncharacterized protein YqfB (UPF0267 family)
MYSGSQFLTYCVYSTNLTQCYLEYLAVSGVNLSNGIQLHYRRAFVILSKLKKVSFMVYNLA